MKQKDEYQARTSSCRSFPLLFPAFGWTAKPRGTVNCLGLCICLSLFTSLSLTPPPSPSCSSGGWRCDSLCPFFISSTLDRLGEEGVNVFWQAPSNCWSFSSLPFLWNSDLGEQHNKMLWHWNVRLHYTGLGETALFMKIFSCFCLLTNLWVWSEASRAPFLKRRSWQPDNGAKLFSLLKR